MTQMLCINVCPDKKICLNGTDKVILVHLIITSFKNTFDHITDINRGNIGVLMISESKLETMISNG